jgi:hypothetical protein
MRRLERKVQDNGSGDEICKKCTITLKSALRNHQVNNGQLTRVEEEAEQQINGSSNKR